MQGVANVGGDMDSKNKVVSFRLGSLQDSFEKRCEVDNLKPAELIKVALRNYLSDEEKTVKDISFSVEKLALDEPKKRIEVTLTESEISALETIKSLTVYQSYQAIIVGILRAYILNKPVFQIQEVEVLRRANTELNAMGRNFNQLIKLIHLGDMEAIRALNESNIEKIILAIEKHADFCRKVVNEAILRTKFKQD